MTFIRTYVDTSSPSSSFGLAIRKSRHLSVIVFVLSLIALSSLLEQSCVLHKCHYLATRKFEYPHRLLQIRTEVLLHYSRQSLTSADCMHASFLLQFTSPTPIRFTRHSHYAQMLSQVAVTGCQTGYALNVFSL